MGKLHVVSVVFALLFGTAICNAAPAASLESDESIEQLLNEYDQQKGKIRVATADRIFDLLYQEEMTDDRLVATSSMPSDSLDMLVWYWAGEYLWTTQDYAEGLRYSEKALPLTSRLGDLALQSDCERLVGLFHFRRSEYEKAVEHVSKSLEISQEDDDKSRIGSSLNTLAGICLTARQLDDSEKYILEAIRYCEEDNDTYLLPIRYGMASEVYHAKGEDTKALEYATLAYQLDSARQDTARVGIRLSQMAAVQMALEQDEEAEQSLSQAIPILEKAGNIVSLSICRNQMGELLNKRGEHREAALNFENAAESFAARKDMYNESRAQLGLYEALKDSDPGEASQHLLRYSALKDSIYHRDMEQAVSQFNVKYNTEELVRQQQQEQLEKRNILLWAIGLIAFLLLLLLSGLFTIRMRRRKQLELERYSALREDFFTNITHELRSPLTVILGLSHDLQSNENEDVKEKAQTIEKHGNSLLTLINQLLDISKIKSAVGNADWRNGNVMAYLTMIVESYRDFAQSHDVDLTFKPKGEVQMDFVPDYLDKVMNNLLSNALKFTPEQGKVDVSAWQDGDRLCIDVSDTGEGMDQETIAHIFDPFYQAGNGAQGAGTGVGLTLVKQIMDTLKGDVEVESVVGKGTTFHLSLPVCNNVRQNLDTEEVANTPMLPQEDERPRDIENGDSESRVLVIEDNHDVAAYIGSHLSDKYTVIYADNGREGLEKVQELVPDVIVTDLMMPELDGLEICRQVRGNEIVNHIPIIVVTAKITDEERIKGLEAGADAYLTKPFNADELRTRVEMLLDGRRLLREKYAQVAMDGKKVEQQDAGQLNRTSVNFLSRISEVVYSRIDESQTTDVASIASCLFMSNSQFYRKLVALTGYKPSAYIQRIKIQRAKDLLDSNPQMSFSEVADRCGFDVYPNFVRTFKNVLGVTPTEYARNHSES